MLDQLKPKSQEALRSLEVLMRKRVFFTDVDQFLAMYNLKVLDSRNPGIQDVSSKLQDTFENLILTNGRFIVEYPIKKSLDNVMKRIEHLKSLSLLKRVALLMMEEGLSLQSKIVFSDVKRAGYAFTEQVDPDTGEVLLEQFWLKEKICDGVEDILSNVFLMKYALQHEEDENAIYFTVEDIVGLDDSFIVKLEQILNEAIL